MDSSVCSHTLCGLETYVLDVWTDIAAHSFTFFRSTKILAQHVTRRLRPLNADYLIFGSLVIDHICMKCNLY